MSDPAILIVFLTFTALAWLVWEFVHAPIIDDDDW